MEQGGGGETGRESVKNKRVEIKTEKQKHEHITGIISTIIKNCIHNDNKSAITTTNNNRESKGNSSNNDFIPVNRFLKPFWRLL